MSGLQVPLQILKAIDPEEPFEDRIFFESLKIPGCLSLVSFLIILHTVRTRPSENDEDHLRAPRSFKEKIQAHGGTVVYLFKVARLLISMVLLCLAVFIVFLVMFLGNSHGIKERLEGAWSLFGTFLYTTVLSVSCLFVDGSSIWNRTITRHLNVVFFGTFAVWAYWIVYPVVTGDYVHISRENLTVAALMGVVGLVIPLFLPRQHIPADPQNPSTGTPEQTTSLFSLATYLYLDPIIFYAYRVPHLSWEKLPPLSDTDFSRWLKKMAFKHVDPFSGAPTRYIGWGLAWIFRYELIGMVLVLSVRAFASYLSPFAMKQLLSYLEHNSGGSVVVRPWVWIVSLFFGPVLSGMAIQWYGFLSTRSLARMEVIITQLVLEHSLRVRAKSDVSDVTSTPSRAPTPPVQDGEETENGTSSAPAPEAPSPQSGSANLIGRITNLITTDLDNITEIRDFMYLFMLTPLQTVVGMVFLYVLMGWSALVGFGTMIVLGPLPGLVASKIKSIQGNKMEKTDARVGAVTEVVGVMRMIKLFGWERKMAGRVAEKREEELVWSRRRQYWDLLNDLIMYLTPTIVILVTFCHICTEHLHTLGMKKELTASTVFSSMTVIETIRRQIFASAEVLSMMISGKVSLDRLYDFLNNTELLDTFVAKSSEGAHVLDVSIPANRTHDIGFRNAIFTWTREVDGTSTPSRRRFVLKIDDELVFKKGSINLVLGETGSGKTTLLMALLSEICYTPVGPDSWYNLPRQGGVAYAAQESWVQNETIKDNIVFNDEFDEERYKKVIYQCALEQDIARFEAGDQTEVGEKGITLSGGQKARITLARAIYSKAEIILLDDVLAALDVHTSKWVVDKCLKGDLVKGRTVILVTHNVALARPIAGFVVSLKDGAILSQGGLEDALEHSSALQAEASKDEQRLEQDVEELEEAKDKPAASQANGKLILAEEIQEGRVTTTAIMSYLSVMGSWPFFATIVMCSLTAELFNTGQTWFLGYWTSQYATHHASEVSVPLNLAIYTSFFVINITIYSTGTVLIILGTIRASRIIHYDLVESVLGTTLRWIDTTPVSRIITRCTQDIRVIDGPLAATIRFGLELTTTLIIKFLAVIVITPLFSLPGIVVTTLGMMCGQIYIKAQMAVKREMSNARAPVVGLVGSAIAGLASIRAYGVEKRFIEESLDRIDKRTRTARAFYSLNRWIGIRMDILSGLFASGLAAYLVYGQGLSAPTIGFSLNMAIGFSVNVLYWIRNMNNFEVYGNSVERIHSYTTIEQEPKPTESGNPPAYWPATGDLKVEKLSAKYSSDGPRVLHDISFEVRSGERIGVVGRTGSGKSSLTLSLLRCIFTEGKVLYDGIPTDSINLEALRSSITIIPQMPELLSGTIRQNLDPFEQYDDAALHSALRSAGLYSLQQDEGRLTLDSAISSGGGNLSVGQRQILALARALVRGSKLLILDEATSAIDYQTDSVIQSSLRNELPKDVTLITVAHRLQTIMDADKILVLESGRIVEFDTPRALLEKEDGLLKGLVEQSNDKDVLYSMAKSGRSRDA